MGTPPRSASWILMQHVQFDGALIFETKPRLVRRRASPIPGHSKRLRVRSGLAGGVEGALEVGA